MDNHTGVPTERAEVGQLLRMGRVAERLDISLRTAYTLAKRGTLPTVRVGRTIRVPVSDLEAWLSASRRGGIAA